MIHHYYKWTKRVIIVQIRQSNASLNRFLWNYARVCFFIVNEECSVWQWLRLSYLVLRFFWGHTELLAVIHLLHIVCIYVCCRTEHDLNDLLIDCCVKDDLICCRSIFVSAYVCELMKSTFVTSGISWTLLARSGHVGMYVYHSAWYQVLCQKTCVLQSGTAV